MQRSFYGTGKSNLSSTLPAIQGGPSSPRNPFGKAGILNRDGFGSTKSPRSSARHRRQKPELPPPAPPPLSSARGREDMMQRTADEKLVLTEAGHGSHALEVGDLVRSQTLTEKFKGYQLKEYFDEHGNTRYNRLGFAFAAKQNQEVSSSFGSTSNYDAQQKKQNGPKKLSARQYRQARAAIEKDEMRTKEVTRALVEKIGDTERNRSEDVRNHQLDMVFFEVAEYKRHIAEGVSLMDLLPIDMSRDEELTNRRWATTQNALIEERGGESVANGWFFSETEIKLLLKLSKQWNHCTRGPNNPLGLDRATFSSFIIECGLVDSQYCPYAWIMMLFDELARPAKCCPAEATWADQASYAITLCWWGLIAVFDKVLKQHFSPSLKEEFLSTLEKTLKDKMPSTLTGERGGSAGSHSSGARGSISALSRPSIQQGARSSLLFAGGKRSSIEHDPNLGGTGHSSREIIPPSWLQPPEMPALSIDVDREILQRNRLIQSMLMEPETLQITAQRVALFSGLFEVYASDGHMTFTDFLQFSSDFQLTPMLVPCQYLWDAYRDSQCIHEPEPPPEEVKLEVLRPDSKEKVKKKKQAPKKQEKKPKPKQFVPEPPTEEELNLLDAFRRWCVDSNDGSVITAFKYIDTNGNGKVSRQEFVDRCMVKRRGRPPCPHNAAAMGTVFCLLDAERTGNGIVGWNEFIAPQWQTPFSDFWEGTAAVEKPFARPSPPEEPKSVPKSRKTVSIEEDDEEEDKDEKEKEDPTRLKHSGTLPPVGQGGYDKGAAELTEPGPQTPFGRSVTEPSPTSPRPPQTPREELLLKLEEFRLWCLEAFEGSPTKAFRHFDTSANGFVTRAEFCERAKVKVKGQRVCPGDSAVHKKLFTLLDSDASNNGRNLMGWKEFVGSHLKTASSILWERAASSKNRHQGYCFGLAAFVETILKVCFVHLHAYGNGVQQSLTARARSVWVLTYLQFVFEHLQKSRKKRGFETSKTKVDEVLRTLHPEVWTKPQIEWMEGKVPTPPVAPKAEEKVSSSSSVQSTNQQRGNKSSRHTVGSKVDKESALLQQQQQLQQQKEQEEKKKLEEDALSPDEPLMRSPLWFMTNASHLRQKQHTQENDDAEVRYDIERMELTPPPLGVLGEDFRVRLEQMLQKGNGTYDDQDEDDDQGW